MTAVVVAELADAAFLLAVPLPARSAERRAACHTWVALTTPPAKTIDAARRSIQSYGTAAAQQDALALLDRLANAAGATTDHPAANPPEAKPARRTR